MDLLPDAPPCDPLPAGPARTALYVHVPFCEAKCHYCDFFSVPAQGQDLGGTLEAILAEAELRAPRNPETVFLGGGTPSLLDGRALSRLLDALHEQTGFRDSAHEVTAECNPESLDRDKAARLLDLGVGRLSIGFQSLSDETLRLFGRVHDVESSFRAYDAARQAGARNVNVDLIYAVPGQSPEDWRRDLERVLALEPDHLSAYNLTFEEDTRFRRWLEDGRLEKASEEVELACFEVTRAATARAGLEAYEISNYARPGRECRHNLGYWQNRAYVGIGPSAVSGIAPHRGGNAKPVATYRRWIAAHGHATHWRETRSPLERLAESWWLGLRLSRGVEPAALRASAGLEPGAADPCLEVAGELARHGLLTEREGHWRLTERGLPLADGIAARFLRTGVNEAARGVAR